jgi:hypothetical protein
VSDSIYSICRYPGHQVLTTTRLIPPEDPINTCVDSRTLPPRGSVLWRQVCLCLSERWAPVLPRYHVAQACGGLLSSASPRCGLLCHHAAQACGGLLGSTSLRAGRRATVPPCGSSMWWPPWLHLPKRQAHVLPHGLPCCHMAPRPWSYHGSRVTT